jgi:hypothetical protein
MTKTIWMTSLGRSEDPVRKVTSTLQSYGLKVMGHFWEDDNEKMAWAAVRGELIDPSVSLWLILSSAESLATPSIRYGLSMLAVAAQAQRGLSFPIALLLEGGETVSAETLPVPLKGCDVFYLADPGLGAKLVAKVHTPAGEIGSEYWLDAYGNPQIGQWFEVGPRTAAWSGAMFGVAGGEIAFHGVGSKGSLPSHSVLHHPSQGMKMTFGAKKYDAWAVRNELDPQTSYFVKVTGFPESILFGPFSTTEAADVYVVTLT